MTSQEEKIALVTGAGRGLGLETAKGLARAGVKVVVGVRDEAKGRAAVAAFEADGLSASFLVLDIAKAGDRQAAFAYFEATHGRLDILVNNAGVWLDDVDLTQWAFNSVTSVSEDILRATLDANILGPVLLTQTLLPLLNKSTGARIVNVSSILGSNTVQADPTAQVYGMKAFAYDASKAALNSLTVHLAASLAGTPIKVNSVHPGWVQTNIGGPNAMVSAEEGSRTSVQYALLPPDGPSGGFFHLDQTIPW